MFRPTRIRWLITATILTIACRRQPGSPANAARTDRPTEPRAVPRVAANDNRQPAGWLQNGVLTVRLVAREGVWYPEGPEGTGLGIAAFAEPGKPPQNPGPLIRVPAGTEVHAIVRNALAKPLTVLGLGRQRGLGADSLRLLPGAEREVRFRATTPGTWYYAGVTSPAPVLGRSTEDSQLQGAIVVDPPASISPPADRVFVISWWFTLDSTRASGLGRATLAINGRSWPYTERIDALQGDSLRWRWINLTGLDHPMHLHGFYFRVDAAGDGARYTSYAGDERGRAVTQVLHPGGTMALAWTADRPGNWILHCHFVGHISHLVSLGEVHGTAMSAPRIHMVDFADGGIPRFHRSAATGHQMAGLVLGIRVAPVGPARAPAANPRRLRLLVRSKPNVYGDKPGYAYALGGTAEADDSAPLPARSPTLVLEKGEPVAITVVNHSPEPAAVHWHGIELESFPDGVPGWSGSGRSVLDPIQPGDSLTVRFTPPRAGTFMYHSHFDELDQIASGLYGPIVVLDRGQRYDADTDRVLLFSDGGPTTNVIRGPFPPALLNGRERPEPIELRAGTTYRFRLINIRTDYMVALSLLRKGRPVEWRVVAKDGADLPVSQVGSRPAKLTFAAGEIYDVEVTPRKPGSLRLRYELPPRGPAPSQPTEVAVQVR